TYLSDEEMRYLTIPKGSLDEGERQEIESHVTNTYRFLQQIPWTRELQHVPMIAYGHHEKLDGGGYPRRVTGEAIPIQTRMMTISDIYDALTAADRPYKAAVAPARALDIMVEEVRAGQLGAAEGLHRPQQANGEQRRRERRAARGVLGQLGDEHQPRDDHDRTAHAEQARHHTGHETDHRHEQPRHRWPPGSGCPHPPPPGVSTRTTSPAVSRVLALGGSGAPFTRVRPGAPAPPPPAPHGAWRRRSE